VKNIVFLVLPASRSQAQVSFYVKTLGEFLQDEKALSASALGSHADTHLTAQQIAENQGNMPIEKEPSKDASTEKSEANLGENYW